MAARRSVTQSVVRDTIENAHLVRHPLLDDVPAELISDVAARDQERWKPALDEVGIVVGLQAFKSHGRLKFAHTQSESRKVVELHVRFIEHRGTLAEVGTNVIVDVFVNRAGNRG